jgi:4-nitrophenyl phosphatase
MHVKYMSIDMDGVLWRGNTALPGLVSFFETLAVHGIGFVLATNNATKTPGQYVEKLAGFGVTVSAEQVLNSAEATAGYMEGRYAAGTAVFVVGEVGLRQALVKRGFVVVTDEAGVNALPNRPNIVVSGRALHISYERRAAGSLRVGAGADFTGTNPDPSFPSEGGQVPGAGAIQAVITATTGVKPVIVGKPERAMFDEARRRMGAPVEGTVVLGDRLTTDIAGGRAAGLVTVMVLTGISQRADLEGSEVRPDFIFEDIQELAKTLPEL